MTSLFFSLLPTDLQIDILQGWLNADDCGCSLLKVLSALDVACAMSEQPALRFLMRQLPPFGEYVGQSTTRQSARHIAKYLQWMASRSVPVRALLLAGKNVEGLLEAVGPNLTMPLVETLVWNVDHDFSAKAPAVLAVVRCLPNLTAINVAPGVVINTSFTPILKALTVAGRTAGSPLPFTGPCLQLKELRMGQFPMTVELAQHLKRFCPNLQLLEVSLWSADNFNCLLSLLRASLRLEELVLHNFVVIKVQEIAALFPNIRRLTFSRIIGDTVTVDVFADVISRYPGLEYFKAGNFVCSRKDSKLHADAISAELLTVILSSYSSLEVFSWDTCRVLSTDISILLADKFGRTLTSLNVAAMDQVLEILLQGCGASLKSLCLKCYHDTCPLALIATTCPQLVSLSLHYRTGSKGGYEEGLPSLCRLAACCPELAELTLTIYKCANRQALLKTIIDCKLHLRLLKLFGFEESDAVWFRSKARDQQLIPVPAITCVTY